MIDLSMVFGSYTVLFEFVLADWANIKIVFQLILHI